MDEANLKLDIPMVWLEAIMQPTAGFIPALITRITEGISAKTLWQTQMHNGKEPISRTLDSKWGFLKGVFNLNVDLFNEYRDKMLLQPKSITFLIGNNIKMRNLGKVKKTRY